MKKDLEKTGTMAISQEQEHQGFSPKENQSVLNM